MVPKLPSSFPSLSPTEEDYSSSSSSDSDSSLPSPSTTSNQEVIKIRSSTNILKLELELDCRTLAAVPPRRFTCEDCSMTFNKASALAEHIRGSHPTPTPTKPSTATTTTTLNEIRADNGKYEMRMISARKLSSQFECVLVLIEMLMGFFFGRM